MTLLLHASQISGSGQVAIHAVGTVAADPSPLCAIVIHLLLQPAGRAGVSR